MGIFIFVISFLFKAAVAAAAVRARGCGWWGHVNSSTLSRVFAMLVIALLFSHSLLQVAVVWPLLYLWSFPGWGKYFIAINGRAEPLAEKEFWLADKVIDWLALPAHTVGQRKLIGVVGMSVRMGLILPAATACAFFACDPSFYLRALAVIPLMGGAYYMAGRISQAKAGEIAEYTVGALIAVILFSW